MRDLGFTGDLMACIAIRDSRASENAQARERVKADRALVDVLSADAERRGLAGIDWVEYFRNIGVNYP